MVRLVFRPYTQLLRTICTSVSFRASTRVSRGFTLPRYRSPSFGSNYICLNSDYSGRWRNVSQLMISLRIPNFCCYTRKCYWLLGPCFKTGPCCWYDIEMYEHRTICYCSANRLPRMWFQLFRPSVGVFLNFPSRYLFAVDLLLILRLWWRLPSFTLQSQGALLLHAHFDLIDQWQFRICICVNNGCHPFHVIGEVSKCARAHIPRGICSAVTTLFARR